MVRVQMVGESSPVTGFFGKVPRIAGFVGDRLPVDFTDRWDRWWGIATGGQPPTTLAPDRPVWRFAARAGVFGSVPAAGVWRLSSDRAGGIYPLVIATLGPAPLPEDRWYDAAATLAMEASDGTGHPDGLAATLARLPSPATSADLAQAVLMWRDDWEVHELTFPTARDFAEFGLPGAA